MRMPEKLVKISISANAAEDGACADMQCVTTQQRKISSLKEGIMDLDNILSTITKLCKDPNCAFAKTGKPASADRPCAGPSGLPVAQLEGILSNMQAIAPPTQSLLDNGLDTADTVKPKMYNIDDEIDWTPIQKLCKDPVCYSAYMGFRTPKSERSESEHHHCGDELCLGKSGKICKSKMCPFHPDFGRKTDDIWKKRYPTYPEEAKLPKAPKPSTVTAKPECVGLCGRTSCPFASMEIDQILNDPRLEANIAAGISACGNPCCQYSKPPPVSLCGQPSCPFANAEDPCAPCSMGVDGGLVPCPYAGEFKSYPCGSPSCPNVNPSGMIYTHYYANDYGFVQEAARPYCGSACPYDYMSSLENQFPQPYSENYNTFSQKYPPVMPSCPYLSKGGRKAAAEERRQIADNCNPKLCPYSDGVDVSDPCGSFTCVPEKSVRCSDKTCPAIKKFAICEDCGGIIPESFEQVYLDDVVPAEEVLSILSAEVLKKSTSKEIVEKEVSSAILEEEVSKTKEVAIIPKPVVQKPVKEKEETKLYQYPGVQLGHVYCRRGYHSIPWYMGWAWNLQPPGSGNSELWRGYKPGAVTRTVYKIIKAHRKLYGIYDPSDMIKKKKSRTKFKLDDMKHTVELKKNKDGDYTITMNPLKDPKTLMPYENPYLEVSPMQFKVEKEKKVVDVPYCPCDVVTPSISSASSEINFHFSPPAAIPPTKQRKVKHLTEMNTQYNVADFGGKGGKSGKSVKGGKGGKGGKGKKKK